MPLKILIVDDDSDVRQTLRAILGPLGDIMEASNGADALRLVAGERPALILADVSMPRMDGLEFLEAVKKLDPTVVVVMLTAERDLAVAKKALEDGARAFVTKPFDAYALRNQVRDLTGLSAAYDAAAPYRPWRIA
jgi:CheY-like chemotaxis protein